MAAYAGDSFGQASALFNADDQAQRAAAADAWNQMLQRGMQRRQMNQEQNQFVAQLQADQNARQQQAAYQNRVLGIDAGRLADQAGWENRKVALSEKEFDWEKTHPQATPADLKANQDEMNSFSALVEDPTTEVDFAKAKTLTPSQVYALGQRRKSVLASALQNYQGQEDLSDMENELAGLHQKIPTNFNPAAAPSPTTGSLWWKQPNPDLATYQQNKQLYDRATALRNALAPYDKTLGQYVRINPQTLSYSPVMAAPAGYVAPSNGLPPAGGNGLPPADRSMAGGFAQPTVTGTNLPLPTMPPTARSGVPAIAPARVYRDKSGARWQYVGQMADPMQDTNAANWQQMQ